MAGGLSAPRPPAEIQRSMTGMDVLNGKAQILTINGINVTAQYIQGAHKAGVTAALLSQHGVKREKCH